MVTTASYGSIEGGIGYCEMLVQNGHIISGIDEQAVMETVLASSQMLDA